MAIDFFDHLVFLQPLHAASFTISIAYIGLERYRYRNQIQSEITACINEALKGQSEEVIQNTADYKRLKFLPYFLKLKKLEDNSFFNEDDVKKYTETLKKEVGPFQRWRLEFFRYNLDLRFIVLLSLFSFISLATGSIGKSQSEFWLLELLLVIKYVPIKCNIYISLLGAILPIGCILFGHGMVSFFKALSATSLFNLKENYKIAGKSDVEESIKDIV